MAFFSAVSSSIGKKLLLYGLRHIDILDKDPADFVSVDVGKRTTLEVRDVGLHIKKLVALLHLKLPPEIHLSSAKASLLRVTFVLDFGVPQISIEVDGIQVKAKLLEEAENVASGGDEHARERARSSSPRRRSDDTLLESEEHVPTVEDLAQSFLREEPAKEIRELAQELESQPSYMQDSLAASDDGEEEGSAGVGAPLCLPAYLRNLLNTALDRLSIVVDNIDVEMEDLTSAEPASPSKPSDSSPVSLNFHMARIGIDSVSSEEPHINISPAAQPHDTASRVGKRRLRIENICARLVSDAENFISQSSRPLSPETTRSEVSTEHRSYREQPPNAVHFPPMHEVPLPSTETAQHVEITEPTSAVEKSIEQLKSDPVTPLAASSQEENPLTSSYQQEALLIPAVHEAVPLAQSVATVDDDRFADASSDDGSEPTKQQGDLHRSENIHIASGLRGSSILYDDEGVLDYALQHDMLDSTFDHDMEEGMRTDDARFEDQYDGSSGASSHNLSTHASGASSSVLPPVSALGMSFAQPKAAFSPPASEASTSTLPTVSGLGVSFLQIEPESTASRSLSRRFASLESSVAMNREPMTQSVEDEPQMSTDNLHASEPIIEAASQMSRSASSSSSDASGSMYMSAVSAAPVASSHRHLPGGWDSSSTSSRGASSDNSGSVPEEMISGSILQPHPEIEDGYDTPRPGSAAARQPTIAPSSISDSNVAQRQAKVFLTVDEVTVWFPLALDKGETLDADSSAEPVPDASTLNFAPSRLGEDSIFAEMPGSFSNYAHSTSSRRPGSMMESLRRPAQSRPTSSQPTQRPVKASRSPNIIVDVGSMVGHVDLSTGRIMFNMLNRVLGALTDGPQPQKPSPSFEPVPSADSSTIELTVRNIGIAWLDSVMTESMQDGFASARTLEPKPNDALLGIHLAEFRLTSQSSAGKTRAKLQIEKFAIASLGIDIIAFHTSRPRTRRSVSNLADQLSHDLELDYEQGAEKRVTIVTRPVKVHFDIQQLDDALSSFGGFSGVLELGNSISSHNALNSPVLTPARARPRGVHFGDSPPAIETPAAPSNMPKIQIQLGEVAFLLKGRSCAVQLQTTTVRIAVRQSNVRLKVSEVQLSGPYLDAAQKGAPLLVDVQGTTVNFLYTPEEADLSRLISLITPSKDPYENNEDILIDTFLRQRRKGSVLRVEVSSVGVRVSDLQELRTFESLGAELARLSKVTKYLPEDDRPGLLTLASVQQLDVGLAINQKLGDVSITAQNAAVAHVGFPALFAAEIGTAFLKREDEVLIHEVVKLRPQDQLPMIMVRMVGDELEPVVKAKLFNLCAEYRVSTVMAALGIGEDGTIEDIAVGIASSVATITRPKSPQPITRQSSDASSPSSQTSKPLQIDLLLRSCAIGLNPRILPSKGLFVFTDAHLNGRQAKKDYFVQLDLRKASIHAIDDVARLDEEHDEAAPRSVTATSRHLQELGRLGFVSLSSISAAKVLVNIAGDGKDIPQLVNVEFKNELLVLESCADSTQTLIEVLNGLQPPTPPSTAERYRTVVPLQEMMESFTGDAMPAQDEFGIDDFMNNADLIDDDVPTNLEFVGSIYSQGLPTNEGMDDSMLDQDGLGALAASHPTRDRGDRDLLGSFQDQDEVNKGEDRFDFSTDYFQESDSEGKGKARKWDSKQNQYHLTNEFKAPDAPLKVTVRDVNVIWNLFDGYDWPRTRAIISQAVDDVEARAEERRRKPREEDEDDDFVEEDFLFNSVWIGVPINEEKGALARKINHDIDDLVSETGSYATSTATRSTGATARPRSATKSGGRRLKLERSKHKKIAFSLMGVAVDLIVFPPDSGETLNSIDVRVQDFEIFDHVPTSTWKKFITCIIPPAQRELDRPMINLNLLTVKPVTDLAASELVIRVAVLPLRLHVDQDALDFITRFFEFKDDSVEKPAAPSEQPFIQRLEVQAVQLKLDYKPKRVDYGGIRSGHTTEFMNFLILDGSDITLRHAIVYGITSFDKLHKTLNDVWMPDVKRNQLPGVLSGLAAVRPLVNVGSGMRDLVVVPMREYQKDGRIVRSLQKGVYAFAKNTTSEVARLGAKVAIGTQTLLEGAEAFLNPNQPGGTPHRSPRSQHLDWTGSDPPSPDEEPRAVSNYANQPLGVRAGLRSAARHLERDLLTARDAVIAIPAEVMEQGSGVGVARALARHAPTVILRPAVGATKALSNALLGVGNALDEGSRRKIEDKYKSY
ncbi:autophagy- protein 2 [Didymella heteroderae]|uniref:Autophagy-related protein 2 n=1 Tax=Didymella heteroderae TaxID=1769908 RepID=A0A9P5C1R9_9PLEO|nr:autophagy- protein 2 [Didymella heteroderae]